MANSVRIIFNGEWTSLVRHRIQKGRIDKNPDEEHGVFGGFDHNGAPQ